MQTANLRGSRASLKTGVIKFMLSQEHAGIEKENSKVGSIRVLYRGGEHYNFCF